MPRLELQLSPYTKYTKEQLDMRRKVEILKYKGNGNNQSRLTKKERFAQAVRSNYDPRKYSHPNDYTIPFLTSASGIVGEPQTYLLEDPSVPLYNYNVGQEVAALAVEEIVKPWQIVYPKNVQCLPGLNENMTTITTLLINSPISSKQTTFRLQTPVSAILRGTYLPFSTSGSKITVNFNAITFKIYYNEQQLTSPIGLSANFSNGASREMELKPTISQSATQDTYDFETVFDLGSIDITGITIPTEPNYLYTFRLSYNVSFTSTDSPDLPSIMRNNSITNIFCNTDPLDDTFADALLDSPSVNVKNTEVIVDPSVYTFQEIIA